MMCFEEWSDSILSNCGHYYSTPIKNAHQQIGDFRIGKRHGVEVAEMSCRIDRIDRSRSGILRDENEFLFLLLQKNGQTGVVHSGREEVLTPGDGLLLDSTRRAELRFEGREASFISVHLPRAMCLEGRKNTLSIGNRIDKSHPLHASLKKLLVHEGDDDVAEMHPEFLFDFVALMFRDAQPTTDASAFRDPQGRFRLVRDTIEQHMSDSDFSIERLATLVHMSRRQLQRDFQNNGTSFTRHLSDRRLKSVAAQLRRAAQSGQRPRISDLAFGAGFNDLSYFNREFRKRYGVSPSGYLSDQGNGD